MYGCVFKLFVETIMLRVYSYSMKIDPIRFGAYAKYIEGLPQGAQSYLDTCLVNSDLVRPFFDRHPDLVDALEIPQPVRTAWREVGETHVPIWRSEVHFMSMLLFIRALKCRSDDDFLVDLEGAVRALVDRPQGILGTLSQTLSPSLQILGASGAWSRLHRGSKISTLGGTKLSYKLALDFPPGLFNPFMLRGFAKSLEILMSQSRRGKGSVMTVANVIPGRCEFHGVVPVP